MTHRHHPRTAATARRPSVTAPAVVVALICAVAALVGGAAPAGAAPGDTGWIRAAHLAPGSPKADVVLSPFEGGETFELTGVAFSDVTEYARVPVGLYTVDVRAQGADEQAAPMVTRTVRVTPDAAITVVASGAEGDVTAQPVYDDLRAPAENRAKVRLISAVPGTEVTARVQDGPLLARDVTTGSATGYAEVAAQTWTVTVETADGESTARGRVPVQAGGVYTLLAVEGDGGDVELQAVQDSAGSSVMPQGGVDTGAGGLATADDAGTGVASGGLLAAALLLLGGGLALVVGRRTGSARAMR